MSNLAEYFSKNRYQPTWQIGDRVYGKHENILFIGTVGNDTLISEEEGPRVTVHLDLPLNGKSFITTKPKSIKRLKNYDKSEESKD